MLYLDKIIKTPSTNYEVFFNNSHTYNLVSDSNDDVKILHCSSSGMMVLNQSGYVQEVEILFTNPICSYYPNYTSKKNEHGLPIFEHALLNDNAITLLYLDWNHHRSLLLFKTNVKEFDLKISYKNISFLFI